MLEKYEDLDGWNKRAKDLTNMRFDKLVAIRPLRKTKHKTWLWLCKCDCGETCEVRSNLLLQGNSKSCGCTNNIGERVFSNHDFIEGTCPSYLKSKLSKNNKSGIKGVSWSKEKQKFVAQIQFKKRVYYLGRYNTLEEAKNARKIAEEKLFGDFLQWYEGEYKQK